VICLIVAGKLFHTRGPVTEKLLSPRDNQLGLPTIDTTGPRIAF